MAEKRNLTTRTTVQNLIAESKKVFATKAALAGVDAKVNTLIGADTGKSARAIAAEELAAQLVPENAIEALDTLQEIAAWIQSHPEDVAAINAKLTLGTHNVTQYVKATGTFVDGTTYYTDDTGATPVDSSSFVEGTTDVSNYYVATQVAEQYSNVKTFVEAVEAALGLRITALENVGSTKVEASETNGNIKVDGQELTVYTLPDDVLHEEDIVDFNAETIAKMLADPNFTLNKTTVAAVAGGEGVTFTATAPAAITVTATSSSDATATVATDGGVADGANKVYTFTVTGVAAGNATITVVGSDNEYATEEVSVIVSNA